MGGGVGGSSIYLILYTKFLFILILIIKALYYIVNAEILETS